MQGIDGEKHFQNAQASGARAGLNNSGKAKVQTYLQKLGTR